MKRLGASVNDSDGQKTIWAVSSRLGCLLWPRDAVTAHNTAAPAHGTAGPAHTIAALAYRTAIPAQETVAVAHEMPFQAAKLIF